MRDYGAICDIIEQRWKSLWMNDELEALLRWIDLLPRPCSMSAPSCAPWPLCPQLTPETACGATR